MCIGFGCIIQTTCQKMLAWMKTTAVSTIFIALKRFVLPVQTSFLGTIASCHLIVLIAPYWWCHLAVYSIVSFHSSCPSVTLLTCFSCSTYNSPYPAIDFCSCRPTVIFCSCRPIINYCSCYPATSVYSCYWVVIVLCSISIFPFLTFSFSTTHRYPISKFLTVLCAYIQILSSYMCVLTSTEAKRELEAKEARKREQEEKRKLQEKQKSEGRGKQSTFWRKKRHRGKLRKDLQKEEIDNIDVYEDSLEFQYSTWGLRLG